MTNDDGRKPEGASEHYAKVGAGATWALTGMAEAFFRTAQDGDCRATVARRATGTGGARDECLDRQVKQVARACARRRGYSLKEREHDDRDDEITRLKSKVGEITMDNELLYAKMAAMEGKRLLAHRR